MEEYDDVEPMFDFAEDNEFFNFEPIQKEKLITRRFFWLRKIFSCCRCLKVIRKKEWTPQIRTLAVTFVLFACITGAQFVAALFANSLALISDCASMLIDTLSYMGNLSAECSDKDALSKEKRQLLASGASLTVLLGITGYVIYNAAERLIYQEESSSPSTVNGGIVFIFAVLGLLFDFISICSFYYWSRGSTNEVNMCSALLHVGADTVRSTTTLAESILIMHFQFDGRATDAWASIIVSGLITIASLGGLYNWSKQVQVWIKKKASCFVPMENFEDDMYDISLDSQQQRPRSISESQGIEMMESSSALYNIDLAESDDIEQDPGEANYFETEFSVNPFLKNKKLNSDLDLDTVVV